MLQLTTTKALQLYQVLRQAALILTSIFLAKSQLSTAQIGHFEALLYLGTVTTFFWVSGLLQSISPLYSKMDDDNRKSFIFNVFLVFCGMAVLLFLLLFFGKNYFFTLLTGLSGSPVFELFCWYLLLNLPAFPVEYFYLLKNKPWAIAAWGAASFGLHLAFLVVPIWLGWGLEAGIRGLVLLAALRFLWTLRVVFQYGNFVFKKSQILDYLRFATPLMGAVITAHFVVMFDAWLVGRWFQDDATFAIYRFGARELPLLASLALSLGIAIVPPLTEDLQGNLATLKAMSRKLFHLIFPVSILCLFLAKPFFPVIFNPDFAASAPIFIAYICISASRVLLPGSIILALGKPRINFFAGLTELTVKIATGLIFIQLWGLVGLAWSAVLSFWVEKIFQIWYLEKRESIPTHRWLDLKWYFGYLAAMVLAVLAVQFWL